MNMASLSSLFFGGIMAAAVKEVRSLFIISL
jgi:hypothetical protein